ncbi:MAG: EAL domain-containing protein [Lachnospiraceae bacterium]|nr:EAL domain-containing protein [Lachnospiraceae bacterium]
MREDKKFGKKRKIVDILKGISASKKVPKGIYFLILFVYVLCIVYVNKSSRSEEIISVFGNPIPAYIFTGVYSSLSNICVIFLVVLFRRLGFFTSVFLLFAQFPMLFFSFFIRHSATVFPGLFTNVVSILGICIIFFNNRRILKYQEKIREVAVTDTLTGLPNRYACTELMNSLIKKKIKFALVSVNLNNFRSINDTLGHKAGDEMLIEIANRWRILADSGETGTYDFPARLGSDEYSFIIRAYENEEEILETIKKYEEELGRKILINNCDFFMTACFGIAEYPKDASDSGSLFSCADAALHEVKRNGDANNVLHFTPELSKTERYMAIERRIRAALDSDEIIAYLQPQYDMSHKLIGFEALARIKDENGNFISPMEFIPIAEKSGLIDRVDNVILRKAAKFIVDSNTDGKADISISSNISVLHLMKNDFIEEIKNLLDLSGADPKKIKIEITESIMIESDEKALKRIEELKELGMQVAIDDFGTGYSSLSYLHKFPASMLKIDKSFIDVMNNNESTKNYVALIISIGHILNLEVISEGVESDEQLDTLKTIGCDYIQGYVWGKPMPLDEALKLLKV